MQNTSYILTYRESGDSARRANLIAVLEWLQLQQLGEIILVEQDVAPSLGDLPPMPGLHVVFAYNPGAFNKSWGLNVARVIAAAHFLVLAMRTQFAALSRQPLLPPVPGCR